MNYKHLFGPVPSRRLGISLGVDLVPHKVCTLDCVYCEVGGTTNLTIERKEYIPTKEILMELEDYLSQNPTLDYITFSGAGEPTLHSGIGEIIQFIKSKYAQYKLCLITNSTLFWNESLRQEIMSVDLILPSLDAVSDTVFQTINRPCSVLKNDKIISGLLEFSKEYKGKMWLEIFFIEALNDSSEEIEKFKQIVHQLKPEQVQLNSLDRPGTETWVKKASYARLEEIQKILDYDAVTIIAKKVAKKVTNSIQKDVSSMILNTISRRPCTAIDIAEMTGLHINEINKYLRLLEEESKIVEEKQDRGVFYKILS